MEIPERVKRRIEEVAAYVQDTTSDWKLVKIELVKSMPREERRRFSKRHPSSRKMLMNDFEREIIRLWKEITDVELKLNPEEAHPKDWTYKPLGWALRIINEERKIARQNAKKVK